MWELQYTMLCSCEMQKQTCNTHWQRILQSLTLIILCERATLWECARIPKLWISWLQFFMTKYSLHAGHRPPVWPADHWTSSHMHQRCGRPVGTSGRYPQYIAYRFPQIHLKHFFWYAAYTEDLENAQPYQHLRPSSSCHCTEKIWR